MARYIYAEDFLDLFYVASAGQDKMFVKVVEQVVEDTPTADVVEVKHGKWIIHQNREYWHYDCPFCDDGFLTESKMTSPPNYCSNCGAKMDGKDI